MAPTVPLGTAGRRTPLRARRPASQPLCLQLEQQRLALIVQQLSLDLHLPLPLLDVHLLVRAGK
ncbi:MAG: hypothetical protein GY772_18980 [bacterium]|nr:hypothetical protein [bacterium]